MNKSNTEKRLNITERIFWMKLVFMLLLTIASLIVYRYDGLRLANFNQVSFFDWLEVLLSPHNWLAIAPFLVLSHMIYRCWMFAEGNKFPIIEKYRFIPIDIILLIVLVFIGVFFK